MKSVCSRHGVAHEGPCSLCAGEEEDRTNRAAVGCVSSQAGDRALSWECPPVGFATPRTIPGGRAIRHERRCCWHHVGSSWHK